MNVNKLGKFAVIGLSAAWIAGCSTTATDTDTSTVAEDSTSTSTEQVGNNSSSDQAYGAGEDSSLTSVIVDDTANNVDVNSLVGVETIFYFDFDKSTVRPESREALAKHAAYLVSNPDARIVLEGHADERGTREYNMALGERRAKAVSRFLTIQGVAASQVESVSFGEEIPVAFGHDDSAWQSNRRVEVRYE